MRIVRHRYKVKTKKEGTGMQDSSGACHVSARTCIAPRRLQDRVRAETHCVLHACSVFVGAEHGRGRWLGKSSCVDREGSGDVVGRDG